MMEGSQMILLHDVHSLAKSICRNLLINSKAYEKSIFSEIRIVYIYYVNNNKFCIDLKLNNCTLRKK